MARSSCPAWPTTFTVSASISICASACAPSSCFASRVWTSCTVANCAALPRWRFSKSSVRCLHQRLFSPFVQAQAAARTGFDGGRVNSRINAQHQFTAGRFFSGLSELLAGVSVAIHRRLKSRLKLGHRCTVKRDDVVDVHHSADNDFVFGVKFHAGGVALVSHAVHGVAPIFSINSRAALTRYLRDSFLGCGRWKLALRPRCSKVTAEPGPSTTRQPSATSKASIRVHSILPLAGSASRASRVLWCLLFM